MTAKLYVGNIPYKATEKDLSTLFAKVGTVLASRLIVDKITGKSRGFAFVEMASEAEAKAAIGHLNGYRFMGRELLIHLAHDDRELNRSFRLVKAHQKDDINQPTKNQPMGINQRSAPRANDLQERIQRIRRRTLRHRPM